MTIILICCAVLVLCGLAFFFFRQKDTNSTGSNPSAPGTRMAPHPEAEEDGLWYEQTDYQPMTIQIEGSLLTCTDAKGRVYTTEYKKKHEEGTRYILLPALEDLDRSEWGDRPFYLYDLFYDSKNDSLISHDLPHYDGDGGYHAYHFARTQYAAPPPPVYGPRTDKSDPYAPKTISSKDIEELYLCYYYLDTKDYGNMVHDVYSTGWYEYRIIKESGSYTLTVGGYDYAILLDDAFVEALSSDIAAQNLAALNGIDIHTKGLPPENGSYTIDIRYASGERLYSSANGDDIGKEWKGTEQGFGRDIFLKAVELGFDPYRGEYHTVSAIKRLGDAPEKLQAFEAEVTETRLSGKVPSLSKEAICDYDAIVTDSLPHPELKDALRKVNDEYEHRAEQALERVLNELSAYAAHIDPNEIYYSNAFLDMRVTRADNLFFNLRVEECRMYSHKEIGDHYSHTTVLLFDTERGRELTASELFNDTDALYELLYEKIASSYGNNSDGVVDYLQSDAFKKKLRASTEKPASEGGLGLAPDLRKLDIYLPEELMNGYSYLYMTTLYYEDCGELLSDEYARTYAIDKLPD